MAPRFPFWFLLSLLLFGCTGAPQGVSPITGFELQRYLGTWYEIARLDHSFERGLSQVTAQYSLREDGSIRVLNRGFDAAAGAWREAEGRALPVDEPTVGHLKVSFFGPFYGGYIIFELDPEYRYAFVCGPNRDYLWLLAHEPQVSPEVWERFRRRAQELGFPIEGLIQVGH